MRRLIILGLVAMLCALAASVASPQANAAVVCAYITSMTASGTTVTASFNVVENGCQVSLMGISYANGSTVVVDTSTGIFSVGLHQLQVHLPCGVATEADLILGPPVLFPPPPLDMLAQAFHLPCAPALALTQGYWKNHADAWPVQTITLGGISYTKSQAITLLQTPPAGGNATLILVHQLIAAKLNVAAGAPSSCISATIAAADAWLTANGGANGTVKSSTAAGQVATTLANTLDQYNSGKLCAAGG
ncbi:MAG: hypothetical protein ACXW0R_03030 [Gaiellaceae bacterium]